MLADHLPSALDFARSQFAFIVVWHFLFPAFTIGLASYLAVLEAFWFATGRDVYLDAYRYWLKIFAVALATGVVSVLVKSYQLGTNWSVFSDKTAPVLAPLLGSEVLTAFFLRAAFLGVMLIVLERAEPRQHFLATCLVAGGPMLAAFRILSANFWMQTPAGYVLDSDRRFAPESWWAVFFNPSFPYRFAHIVTAAYLTTAMIVGAVGAWHLLRDVDGGRRRPRATGARRPSRRQHPPQDRQGRGDGGPLRQRDPRTLDPFRLAGRAGGEVQVRDRYPRPRQPLPRMISIRRSRG